MGGGMLYLDCDFVGGVMKQISVAALQGIR